MIGGWIGAVLATFWLGMRIGRELTYGILRARSRDPGGRRPVQ